MARDFRSNLVPVEEESQQDFRSRLVPVEEEKPSFFKARSPGGMTAKEGMREQFQPPLGLLETVTGAFDPHGLSREVLREISEGDEDIIPEVAEAARLKSGRYLPTQRNLERGIEKLTGLPLQATELKHELQRSLIPLIAGGKSLVETGLRQIPRRIQAGPPEVFPKPQPKQLTGPGGEPPGGGPPGGGPGRTPFTEQAGPFIEGGDRFAGPYEMGGAIREAAGGPPIIPGEVPRPGGQPVQGQPLQSRARPAIEPTTPRPTGETSPTAVESRIGQIVSPGKIRSTQIGGRAVLQDVQRLDNAWWEQIGDAFDVSRELNAGIEEFHPQTVQELQQLLSQQLAPVPADVERRFRSTLTDLIESLATLDPVTGQITGYRPIQNQALIDQIRSLNRIISHDFAHGDARNIFRPIASILTRAVDRTAAISEEANASWNLAKQTYAHWANLFDTPYIQPLRDLTNHDFSKTWRTAQDLDEFVQLRQVLGQDQEGQNLLNALARDIVEKRLKPFIEDIRKGNFDRRAFEAELRELESIISPEQIQQIQRELFSQPRLRREVSKLGRPEPGKAPFEDMTNEQISAQARTISGLKEIEKTIKDKEFIKELKESLAADLLTNGKLEPSEKAKDWQKILTDKKDLEYLNYTLGNERLNELRNLTDKAEKIEEILKFLKKAGLEDPKAIKINAAFTAAKWIAKAFVSPGRTLSKAAVMAMIDRKNLAAINRLARGLPKKHISKMSEEELIAFYNKFQEEFKALSFLGESPQ